MKMRKKIICLLLTLTMTAIVYAQKGQPVDNSLSAKINRFAPTTLTADNLTADTISLSPNDRQALLKIIAAAKLFDPLYLRQIWSGNEALLKKLQADQSPLGRLRLHYS